MIRYVITLIAVCLTLSCAKKVEESKTNESMTTVAVQETPEKLLRHIVLFKFKEDASQEDVQMVERAFVSLPTKIKEIYSFEWGTNNSPEDLNKDFTHSFFVTFKSEADREVYLPHPAHLAFVEILKPHLDDVLVLDYWTEN